MSRQFKQVTGETLIAFINRYRIKMAQQYLRHRPDSVTDVAFRVDFNDVTYFKRVFKSYTGMTPLAYLRGSTPTIQP
ncbi:helix-turn-helix transcriptional regulator [Lactobacillus sp. ZJLC3-7]|nr:helix-turn-helix transcriptional regulator [Levilactobacillus tujiorum]